MDSFESVVAQILEGQGYWIRRAYKVDLTKEEKRLVGRPSSPRWEIDIVAYKASTNEVMAVECKSYLDSPGVVASSFDELPLGSKSTYKLFVETKLREVVLDRLGSQMLAEGLCGPAPIVRLALATGHIAKEADRIALAELFDQRGWQLWDEVWLREKLHEMANFSYEDLVPSIVAKLLIRGQLKST